MFRVAAKNGAVVRATAELDSAKQGEIPRHTILRSLERTVLSDGRERVRVAGPPAGWVSRKVLEAVEASDAAPASDAQPVAKKPKAKAKPPRPPPRVDVMRRLTAARTDATRVPWPARIRGADVVAPPRAMRWLHQKLALKQDAFLLGTRAPRQCVLQFCAALGLEVSYVGVTRDTTEADLKQRREIRDGGVFFADQAPVEAAVHGRVLVLEGVEKAERNVLPLLNNLLENREMALEDGTFLSPRAAEGGGRLRRVDPGRRRGGGAGGVYPVFCFKDMSARDLTQRRTTDALGNTVWSDGPLVAAARRGGLCVLDGAHRLARGTLCGAVAPLLCDRSLSLPSGERLVAREHYDDLLSRGFSEARCARGARAPAAALDFGDAVGGALDADPTLAPLLLSTRRLRALATHAAALRGDAAAVLHALSPGFALLPPLGQETASRL
ncbi:ATPase [Aureococcus anophagefferens]|nr:ATPase [Aureococcus anophagefferens]